MRQKPKPALKAKPAANARKATPAPKAERPQNRNLRPNPQNFDQVALAPGEQSTLTRVRGSIEAVQWFRSLTAAERGDLITRIPEFRARAIVPADVVL